MGRRKRGGALPSKKYPAYRAFHSRGHLGEGSANTCLRGVARGGFSRLVANEGNTLVNTSPAVLAAVAGTCGGAGQSAWLMAVAAAPRSTSNGTGRSRVICNLGGGR